MRRFARVDPRELDKIRARALDPTVLKTKWVAISDEAETQMTGLADARPDLPIGVAFVDDAGAPGWIGSDPLLRGTRRRCEAAGRRCEGSRADLGRLRLRREGLIFPAHVEEDRGGPGPRPSRTPGRPGTTCVLARVAREQRHARPLSPRASVGSARQHPHSEQCECPAAPDRSYRLSSILRTPDRRVMTRHQDMAMALSVGARVGSYENLHGIGRAEALWRT